MLTGLHLASVHDAVSSELMGVHVQPCIVAIFEALLVTVNVIIDLELVAAEVFFSYLIDVVLASDVVTLEEYQ